MMIRQQIPLGCALAFLTKDVASYSFFGNSISAPAFHKNGSTLTMKVSKGKSKHGKNNSIHTKNQYRKHTAGKPGTKHFMDPNKVFIGNLPFKATTEDVKEFLRGILGNLHNVESVKVITDWKTGVGKGYGFVQFMDPIYATSSIELIKGKKLMGRVVRFDQGKKKDDDKNRVLFVKKRERKDIDVEMDTEDSVIDGALDEVEALDEEAEFSVNDFDSKNDDLLFGEEDDEEEDDEFAWFEEIYGGSKWEELSEEESQNMNREQRREAQRMKPRRKLPAKGFGDVSKSSQD
jgi:RNA recognition motif-containing protein